MRQYTFSSDETFIEQQVDEIAKQNRRSRSEMIDILLHQAVNERLRKRNGRKKNTLEYNTTNPR